MLPSADESRKRVKLGNVLKLFPDAMCALALHIQEGADKYCDGEIRWDRSKSPDEIESLLRHVLEQVHMPDCESTARSIAWRGMANLQKVIERNR